MLFVVFGDVAMQGGCGSLALTFSYCRSLAVDPRNVSCMCSYISCTFFGRMTSHCRSAAVGIFGRAAVGIFGCAHV